MSDASTPEVEFATESVVTIDDATIVRIRQAAHASSKRRARLCLHRGADDRLHNMLIVLLQGTVVPIHRHPNKAECYHVLSGSISIILYDDSGNKSQRVPLGPLGSGRACLCRIAPGLWHNVHVESEEVVMHESTIGPFTPADTEYHPGPSV